MVICGNFNGVQRGTIIGGLRGLNSYLLWYKDSKSVLLNTNKSIVVSSVIEKVFNIKAQARISKSELRSVLSVSNVME